MYSLNLFSKCCRVSSYRTASLATVVFTGDENPADAEENWTIFRNV